MSLFKKRPLKKKKIIGSTTSDMLRRVGDHLEMNYYIRSQKEPKKECDVLKVIQRSHFLDTSDKCGINFFQSSELRLMGWRIGDKTRNVCMFVCYLLRCLQTDLHQTWLEGRGRAHKKPRGCSWL